MLRETLKGLNMEQIVHTSSQINTNAEKVYLTWNGKLILKSDFGQVPQDVCLQDNDTYLGIVEYPNSALGDKNKYLVAERDNKLVRIPLKHRPYRFDYYKSMKEQLRLIPNIWKSIDEHQQQFHKWNKVFNTVTFTHLYLATKTSAYG